MVERFREQLTTEKLGARIERMVKELEQAAGADPEFSVKANRAQRG
jgi:hypothetical protein